PGVVLADRAGADHDGVGAGAQRVYLVKVFGAGQDQPDSRRVVQVAVDGDRATHDRARVSGVAGLRREAVWHTARLLAAGPSPGSALSGRRRQRSGDFRHKQGMNDAEGSDAAVLTRLRGQPELVGVLYERHAPAVFRFLARRAGPAAAEDLLSEVFIAALGARTPLVAHQSGSALPWLYGIAANVVRHHLRRAAPPGHAVTDPGADWGAVAAR